MNGKEDFIVCDCGEHVLRIGTNYDDVIISILNRQFAKKAPLWFRIKNTFKILRTGYPYGDQIIFGKEQARQLRAFLNDYFFDKNKKPQKSAK